jgi:hypothetical protein
VKVAQYHLSVQRPSGTFSAVEYDEFAPSLSSGVELDLGPLHPGNQCPEKTTFDVETAIVRSNDEVKNHRGKDSALLRELDFAVSVNINASRGPRGVKTSPLDALAAAERERCHLCGGKRQIYCGDCGGIRVGQGGELLPRRVVLPFDLLLIVHWLVRCHSSVMKAFPPPSHSDHRTCAFSAVSSDLSLISSGLNITGKTTLIPPLPFPPEHQGLKTCINAQVCRPQHSHRRVPWSSLGGRRPCPRRRQWT